MPYFQEVCQVPGHRQGVVFSQPPYFQQLGRAAVDKGSEVLFLEAINNVGNLSQQYPSTVGVGNHRNIFQFPSRVALGGTPQPDLAGFALDRAPGYVNAAAANRLRNLLEGQAMATQCQFRNFN